LRVPYSTLWSATIVENGRSIPLVHRQVYGFGNGFMLPALNQGDITIKFSDSSSFVADSGALVSIAASLVVLAGLLVVTFRRRRGKDDNYLYLRKRITN
jgi:hypothetical protein